MKFRIYFQITLREKRTIEIQIVFAAQVRAHIPIEGGAFEVHERCGEHLQRSVECIVWWCMVRVTFCLVA